MQRVSRKSRVFPDKTEMTGILLLPFYLTLKEIQWLQLKQPFKGH